MGFSYILARRASQDPIICKIAFFYLVYFESTQIYLSLCALIVSKL